jgi:hypothetical protein
VAHRQTRDTHTRTHSTLVSLVSFLSFAYICVLLRAHSIVRLSASLLFLLESVALQDKILLPPLLLGMAYRISSCCPIFPSMAQTLMRERTSAMTRAPAWDNLD